MAKADWVRVGHWEFRPGEVDALDCQSDGSLKVHLGSGLVIPLNPEAAKAFLDDFQAFRTLRDVTPSTVEVDDAEGGSPRPDPDSP
jgi:hypothetical protein